MKKIDVRDIRERASRLMQRGREKAKEGLSVLNEKAQPYTQAAAGPITRWSRKFERSFFATTSTVRIFRKTLTIAAVFAGAGLALGSITLAAFLASVKTASIVAGITLGREAVTRFFTDRKTVTWKNEIGQEIEGTKIQKQKLTATQTQINRLVDKFNDVSGPTEYQQRKLEKILREMDQAAREVTVKSAPEGIPADRYVFAVSTRTWKPAPAVQALS